MAFTLALLIAGGALAYVCLIVYRLWLHPLARFPGPRLAAATQWYEAYYELVYKGGARYAGKVRQLHDIYGPVVRINPEELSVRDAYFHDKLYAPPRSEIRDRHPHFSATLGTTKGSFSTVDHQLHRSRRMAYLPFWGSANVMATEPLIMQMINGLCERIPTMGNEGPKLRTLFAAISFDTFYTWAFGSSLGLLDDLQLAYECNQAVEALVTSPPYYRIFPVFMAIGRRTPHAILQYLSGHLNNVLKLNTMICKAAEDWVSKNRCQAPQEKPVAPKGSQSQTLFAVLSNSTAPEEEKSAFRMAQEGVEMFMAAYTPGRTMMFGMYYLHAHPDTLEKLRDELAQVNPDPAVDLTISKINSLPYLRAVVKEILRMTFPVGTRLPMICREDIKYQDWTIPANTGVSSNHRDLLFDPEVFPEPYRFNPERWMDEANPINEKTFNVPFGKGARGCPSKEFATKFIQLTLATLVQRFDFSLEDTIWERDVAVCTESILTAPSAASKGISLNLVGSRIP